MGARGKPIAPSVQAQAAAGRFFWAAITATQLAMVLLAAPAATAGAICLDRARGTLAHMLVTDLILGRDRPGQAGRAGRARAGHAPLHPADPGVGSLARRYRPADGGRGDARDARCGLSGCAAALALSTWGTKMHEVLLATYAAWALWLLALPMWWGYRLVMAGASPRRLVRESQSDLARLGFPYLWPSGPQRGQVAYLGVSLLVSAALSALAVTQLRRVAAREGDRPTHPAATLAWAVSRLLDRFWAWCRARRSMPTRFSGRVAPPAAVALGRRRLVALRAYDDRADRDADRLNVNGNQVRREVASVGNGFQAGIGLLLLSVSAATALAEERVRGNLDILLATPLSTRSIVWGKWWGTFRAVPCSRSAPAVLAVALA